MAIVGMHGLLRKQEILKTNFDDIQVFNATAELPKYYEIAAHRGKQKGPKKAYSDKFHVTEPLCVRLLDLYISCFSQVYFYQ
jgi:hypothetical protein